MKFSGRCAVILFVCLLRSAFASGAQTNSKQSDDRNGVSLPASRLEEYVGQYRQEDEPDELVAINVTGGKLTAEGDKNAPTELKAEDQDRFSMNNGRFELTFVRDAQGNVGRMKFLAHAGRHPGERIFDRVSDAPIQLNKFRAYARTEMMIPMRDGVLLETVVIRPTGSETVGEPLPFLMERTPYGTGSMSSNSVNATEPELAASGYLFVYQDIRGRYKSQGKFVMNRAIVAHRTKNDVDETTDTRDTIDWLLKNVPNNNGKVGVLGVSYSGFLAMEAGIDAHPAVKAISPQAPMTNLWMGDDFFHNGAFRETYGFDYVQQMESQKTDELVQSKEDTYEFFLKHVNFSGAARAAEMGKLPTAKMFLTEPEYTKFWQDMAVESHLTKVEVPTLEVGGWWDQEDMWGTQAEYAALKPHDLNHEVFMVLGPWNHGGWDGTTRHLGALDFGAATGDQYRKTMEAPFFERYLKGRPGFDLTGVASFRTGVNEWKRYEAWPPKQGFTAVKLYLTKDGGLGFAAPAGGGVATYVADPSDPVPYRSRPIQPTYGEGSKWFTWLVEDQRFVSGRKDLVNFSTPVLEKDVTVTGDVVADVFAATTGSDGDFVVKLIDVYPEDAPGAMAGYELMIVDEIFRGRYDRSFERPEALTPEKVTEFKWSLHGADHTFLKGHRMMVEVQSSWFPLYDRNPQTFVPNIMTAPRSAYQKETVSIYGSAEYPSHLEFLTTEDRE
jgi:putative CocE/NonD family hydrolase